MNVSAAIADSPLRQAWTRWPSVQAGGLAVRSVNMLFQVCLPPSRLRAPVSRGDCAISPRTVMNNAGSSVLLAGLVSLGYAGMLLAEGIGLWLEFTWAAYLTVVSTSLLLPFELYEVIERVSMLRVGVLLLNLIIVFYLISQLRRHTLRSRAHLPSHDSVA